VFLDFKALNKLQKWMDPRVILAHIIFLTEICGKKVIFLQRLIAIYGHL
jgi:hypothetical protein